MYAKSEYTKKLEEKNESLKKENQELRSKVGAVAEETIQDLQKRIAELSRELKARVEQVENLQDTLKKITKENLELQDRLKKCENLNRKCTEKRGEEESHLYSKSIADDIDFVNDIKKLY